MVLEGSKGVKGISSQASIVPFPAEWTFGMFFEQES
jgi:hypothetical protein